MSIPMGNVFWNRIGNTNTFRLCVPGCEPVLISSEVECICTHSVGVEALVKEIANLLQFQRDSERFEEVQASLTADEVETGIVEEE